MATKLGVNATKIANSPADLVEQGEQTGRMKVHYDQFTLTADLAANDVIKMGGLLPAGARVIGANMDSPDLDSASAGALQFGWAASADGVEAAVADGFITSMDVHTAGNTSSLSGLLQSAAAGKYKRFSSPVQPQVKISGETDATTGTIRCHIAYVID